jgi:tetratricopeptide (TPR) repeat protein
MTLAALGPTLGNNFINYDDDRYVYANPHVRAGLSAAGLRWALTTFEQANWHPLTWLSHMADVSLFGLRPAGHHATSLLVHIGAAVLLLAVLEAMTGALWRSAFVAALFALHPLHVESVAWVAERKDVLAGFFWMATLAAWTSYVRHPGPGRYLAAFCCCALGLAAKPVLVTLPIVLVLLDFWPLGRWRPGAAGAAGRLLQEKVPLLALALCSGAVTLLAQERGGALKTLVEYPFEVRLANALLSCVAYLAQTVWPARLAVFYPHPGAAAVSLKAGGAALLLAGATLFCLRRVSIRPCLAVGWLWYLVTLAPMLGLIQAGAQARADRYTYLPLVGIFLMVAWGGPMLVPAFRFREAFLGAAAVLAVSGSLVVAHGQVRHWRDSVSLFEHALQVTRGNYIAHDNLSGALDEAGRKREGLLHALEALRLQPDRPERYLALAREFSREGLEEETIAVLSLAIEQVPGFAEGHYALGLALTRRGRIGDARDHFAAAVRLVPASTRYRAALDASQRQRADGGR